MPKGLRSFDEHDADFFLELLPGARDRDGLPESIRFWKRRIEQIDPDETFRVGLIYGPSGCGKSSLVKAGLLPRLAKHVHSVYIEAAPEETETRLLHGLRKVCPDLPPQAGLVDSLAAIRHGRVLLTGQKVLLVLDQFEQWLHATRGKANTELVAALRQCDGEHLQAVVMVRDDFWMAATSFFDDLETDLILRQNAVAVDLFDPRHAHRVLSSLGTAYGKLPALTRDFSRDEHAASWNAKPVNRLLPSWWEHLNIRLLTGKKKWTEPQRKMMSKAARVHGFRSALALVGLVMPASIAVAVRTRVAKEQESTRIEGLVGSLVSAEPNQIPDIVKQLDANPQVASTFLSPLVSRTATTLDEKRAQLHARLAMVSRDPSLVDPLTEELLTGKVTYVAPIRQQLRPAATRLTEKFRGVLRDEKADMPRRFRAALALADYVPESDAASWTEQDLKLVADQLVASNSEFQPLLRDALRPIRARLLGTLDGIFADPKATEGRRLSAANAFADYAAGDIAKLSELLTVATPEQHAVLYPIVAASPSPATVEELGKIAATAPPLELGAVQRVPYGERRANAAVTLLRLGEREKVLPVFALTDDPEALTQFIFRCRPRGVGVGPLLDCFRIVSDGPVERHPRNSRYALLLALGEFKLEEIPDARRETLLKELADSYRNDPSSGVHGAAGWLLRQWGQAEVARQVDQTAVPYSPGREWFTLAITVTPTAPPKPEEKPSEKKPGSEAPTSAKKPKSGEGEAAKANEPGKSGTPPAQSPPQPPAEPPRPKTFFYTFVVFPAGEYTIGSIDEDSDLDKNETRHPVKLTHPFAVLDREITFEELIAFSSKYIGFMQRLDAKPADAGFGVDWYDSVGFCRWLGQQSGLSEADQCYANPESLDKAQYPREQNRAANWAPRDWPIELARRGFRLPTESEWEAGTRAGVRASYGFGSEVSLLGRFGWFAENGGKHVHPPRALRPSMRGVFDLQGNLFEWTHDWFGDYPALASTDPLGHEGGSFRVFRGGSWLNAAANCRSAGRNSNVPTSRTADIGVRLALSPSAVPSEKGK